MVYSETVGRVVCQSVCSETCGQPVGAAKNSREDDRPVSPDDVDNSAPYGPNREDQFPGSTKHRDKSPSS